MRVMIIICHTMQQFEGLIPCGVLAGWWGLSRHFHYVPEITAAFLWSCPGGFTHLLPYFYVVFLTLLLTDRAFRDDERCAFFCCRLWRPFVCRRHCAALPDLHACAHCSGVCAASEGDGFCSCFTHQTDNGRRRCRAKYGDSWRRYSELVPYKMIPYVW